MYEIMRTDDVCTLVYGGQWMPIPNDTPQAVAHGIALIMCEQWAEDDFNTVQMMKMWAPDILNEIGFPADLVDVMMNVATGGK